MLRTGKIFRKNEEEMDPKKKFKVIEGGLEDTAGKEPPDGDWLSGLHLNTVFLGRGKRTSDPVLTEFTVFRHAENSVQLKVQEQLVWFDPGRFCSQTDLVDILFHGNDD